MSNMSYCEFENTNDDLGQCLAHVENDGIQQLARKYNGAEGNTREQNAIVSLYDNMMRGLTELVDSFECECDLPDGWYDWDFQEKVDHITSDFESYAESFGETDEEEDEEEDEDEE